VATATVHYTVQYRILGFLAPASGSQWKAGGRVPIQIALADAAGVPISDAAAAALVCDPCRVTFSASGAQTQSPVCLAYDRAAHRFIYSWRAGDALGAVTLRVSVDYGTQTKTALSETITVTGGKPPLHPPAGSLSPRALQRDDG
jgi:hypothetical protein